MKRLLIFLVLISCAVQADIYKSQNEKGEWVYSDKPSPSAERMKLPPLSTYTPTAQSPQTVPAQQGEPESGYKSMVFDEPENNFTLRDHAGVVNVSVRLDPQLKTRLGHKIQYYLDGTPQGEPIVSPRIILENLERGAHVLGARVLDGAGKELSSAPAVTFYVHRQTVNSPNRVKPQPKPKPPKPK